MSAYHQPPSSRRPRALWWLAAIALLTACAPAQTVAPAIEPTPTAPPPTVTQAAARPTPTTLPEEPAPPGADQFTTDFSRHLVPYEEILSGGPPKGGIGVDRGIPALINPSFVSVTEADDWLAPMEPVILLVIGGDARAYPLQILIWHEIVNDTVGGVPVLVTFCPLCNTAIAFERTVAGQATEFGATGRLRFSNLIMYDRLTETWWQQATGEAIAGELTGAQLTFRPASIIAWAAFKSAYPDGTVLSRDTGFIRRYGDNPYAGYDDVNNPPFLYRGPATPGEMPPVARVLTIDLSGDAAAYPYDMLERLQVVNDTVGGTDVVVLWAAGTASALDAGEVAAGRNVGSASAFARALADQTLTFALDESRIIDRETNSEWDALGRAIGGPLAGKQLAPVVAVNHFWFSWAAFKPETRIYQP